MGRKENPVNPRKNSFMNWEILFLFFDLFLFTETEEEVPPVGHRFHPTDEELINHFLKNKILGKLYLIDEIGEIKINDYDPVSFPSLSKIQSNDPTWYFFAQAMYTNQSRNSRKRVTPSGTWKPTGADREIKDMSGNKIGLKKTLVYYERGAPRRVKNPWVMHEYHIKCWDHRDSGSYVLCKIKYKGVVEDIIPSVGEPSESLAPDSVINTPLLEVSPSQVEQQAEENLDMLNNNLNVQQQAPYMPEDDDDAEIWNCLDPIENLSNINNNMNVQPQIPYLLAQDQDNQEFIVDYNNYTPRPSLSGTIDYSDNDSDAESISATSYQGISSPGDSIGSISNGHFPSCSSIDSCEDLQTSSADSQEFTRCTIQSELEVDALIEKESSIAKTEKKKKGLVITDEAMEKKRKYVIIGFILLLALIGNILAVSSPAQT